MEKNIKQILNDIYSIDPSLKLKEDSLVAVVKELLRAKPEEKINEDFVNNLRSKLMIERSKIIELNPINKNMFNTLIKRFVFAGTAALSIVVLVVFLTLQDKGGKLVIKEAGREAFGELILNSSQSQTTGDSLENSAQLPSAPAKAGSSISAPLGLGGGATEPSSLIAPYPYEITNYKYTYNGGDFELASQGNVYRRTTGGSLGSQMATVIGKMDLNMVDLSRFQNMKVNTLEISEDREYGYSLYIDFRQNTLSMSMNWEKWPTRGQSSEASDQEILSIADKFLADYGINMGNYGKGEVQEAQRYTIMKGESVLAPDTAQTYARDYANVIYPMLINGEQVYDQSGQKYGIGVGIDLAYKRVTSAYNINTGTFESSTYDLETDASKIVKFVEAGGTYGNYIYPEAAKTVNIEIGKPEKGLMMTWQWDPAKSSSNEIFVPALIFPILSHDGQTDLYRTNITAPLAGDLLNESIIRPMPLEVKPVQQ